jgi:hypothetical protein
MVDTAVSTEAFENIIFLRANPSSPTEILQALLDGC